MNTPNFSDPRGAPSVYVPTGSIASPAACFPVPFLANRTEYDFTSRWPAHSQSRRASELTTTWASRRLCSVVPDALALLPAVHRGGQIHASPPRVPMSHEPVHPHRDLLGKAADA